MRTLNFPTAASTNCYRQPYEYPAIRHYNSERPPMHISNHTPVKVNHANHPVAAKRIRK